MKLENVIKKFNQNNIYLCPKCREESAIKNFSLVCSNNHVYDFSKKGYIHLINNYKQTNYGESLFLARNFIFNCGYYNKVVEVIAYILKNYNTQNIIDAGCGEGFYIKKLKEKFADTYFFGLDNSKEALSLAVKFDKENPYMLANLSSLPFRDNSINIILNILTPANYKEFFRVLTNDGVIIKIIPNKDYLKEIRDLVGLKEYENYDTLKLVLENCEVVKKVNVKEVYVLNEESAYNFLEMTPLISNLDINKKELAKKLTKLTVDLEILVLRKK